MNPNESIITAITGAIVAIAGLIFRAKHKKKITRRKTKELDTVNNFYQPLKNRRSNV